MKYTVELDSPDFGILETELSARQVSLSVAHQIYVREYGLGSDRAIETHQRLLSVRRAINALSAARLSAVPERAVPPPDGGDRMARNAGDEMPFVYGKPRNDPRNPKKKVSVR